MDAVDREFLGRIVRTNRLLGEMVFPIINHTMSAEQQRSLGDDLIAIGTEFHRRATPCIDPTVIDQAP